MRLRWCLPVLFLIPPFFVFGDEAEHPASELLDLGLEVELPDRLPSDALYPVPYRIAVGEGYAPPVCELALRLQLVDGEGALLLQAEQTLRPSSRQWRPGQTIPGTRLLLLPPREGAVRFHLLSALHCRQRPEQRFALAGRSPWRQGERLYPAPHRSPPAR